LFLNYKNMSLADKSSLLLIPTGYKSQKVYSIFPTDGVGDFDFSRSSSATRIAKNGLITTVAANVPRLEYPMIDGEVVGCPSLILEPERRNYIQYSEDFSQYSDVSGADIFSNTTISPDGTLNASRVGFGGSEFSRIFINTSTSSNTYTFTLYAKSDTSKKFRFRISDTSGTQYSEDFVTTSKWQRFSYEFIGDPSTCAICNSSDAISGSIDIFGFQLEEGSFPTSYIKSNSGSTTTRSAETANGSGDASTFSDSEGVLMAEISALVNNGESRRISISHSAADTSNRVTLEVDETTSTIKAFMSSGNVTVGSITVNNINQTNNNKIALLYKENTFEMHINGFLLGSDYTIASLPIELSRLQLEGANGSNDFYGKTKQLQYYNSALTDSELEQLTSWTSFTDMAQGQLYTIE
jgi:hypothetical protein